ncbi:MAG: threonine synthase [Tannerellaceae bacterium]|jgi:threonine synthase|nr:threonine synthase [Tannerellaceae bacterium]
MRYYSTNGKKELVSLEEAVIKGLADDGGLFMPEKLTGLLPEGFAENLDKFSKEEIGFTVGKGLFGGDLPEDVLEKIVRETLSFDIPLENLFENKFSLELFHGPTLAFKDVGARFMARLLSHFIVESREKEIHVLVATSGDTGSAVANGFLGVDGIRVHVLYPKGKVSRIQESQFTTLGNNITALEVDGTFDDCQRLVKGAFSDKEVRKTLSITSANSINIGRLLPQTFYYFIGVSELEKTTGRKGDVVFSVPSGNFGNLTAGLMAHKMGLPVSRFIAANNENNVFEEYLQTGKFNPRPSKTTLANAMDVGNPSNFARILALYDGSHEQIKKLISAHSYDDLQIASMIGSVCAERGYILDPHGACGYRGLTEELKKEERGIFLETAHPAKFQEIINTLVLGGIDLPDTLQNFLKGKKDTKEISATYDDFKEYLMAI